MTSFRNSTEIAKMVEREYKWLHIIYFWIDGEDRDLS